MAAFLMQAVFLDQCLHLYFNRIKSYFDVATKGHCNIFMEAFSLKSVPVFIFLNDAKTFDVVPRAHCSFSFKLFQSLHLFF